MKKIEIIIGILLILVAIWFFTRDGGSVAKDNVTKDSFYSTTTESSGGVAPAAGLGAADSGQISSTDNNKKNMTATLVTTKGEVTLELYAERNPRTVENFVKLSNSG